MSIDPIRTPAEALEAALVSVDGRLGLLADPHCDVAAALREAARQIRALASRIAAPDDEALVWIATNGAANGHFNHFGAMMYRPHAEDVARAVIAALREAGALR